MEEMLVMAIAAACMAVLLLLVRLCFLFACLPFAFFCLCFVCGGVTLRSSLTLSGAAFERVSMI